MENETLVTPPPASQKKSGLMFLEIGLLEIAFVIIGIAILLLALNYFNVITLSSISPSLSFLPRQQETIPNNTTQTNPAY